MRQRRNDDITVFKSVDRAHFDAAFTRAVHLLEIFARCDDLGFCRKVRRHDMLTQSIDIGFRFIQQADTCRGYFTDIVRRNIRRHTHRDTGRTVEHHRRQTCWQCCRLVHGAVKVRLPLDRTLTKLAQKHISKR